MTKSSHEAAEPNFPERINGKLYKPGQPGSVGRYICANCIGEADEFLEITAPDTPMPECDACKNGLWYKIEFD